MTLRQATFVLALGSALGVASAAHAADDKRDPAESELWLAAEGRWEFVDDFYLSFGPELRFNEEMSRLDEILPEVGLAWKPLDWLRVGGGYRFEANRRKDGDFRFGHRVHVEAVPSWEVGPIELSYRLRLEHSIERRDEEIDLSDELRQRLSVDLKLHDIVRPFVATEFYAELKSDPVEFVQANLIAGLNFKFDDHRLEAYYRNSRPMNDPEEAYTHILGFGYRFDF